MIETKIEIDAIKLFCPKLRRNVSINFHSIFGFYTKSFAKGIGTYDSIDLTFPCPCDDMHTVSLNPFLVANLSESRGI